MVNSRVSVFRDKHTEGTIIEYMDVVRDITEWKQLLAIIQATQTHHAHAARLAANGEPASGVAHLISNPLASVIGETQL